MNRFHPINIALSPNTERDDIVLAAKILKNPKRLIKAAGDASAVKNLEEKIKEFLPIKYAYAFRSGRSALYASLEALGLDKDDEVLLQSYTCAAVPNAILWTGAKPVYVDIDEDTFNVSVKDLEKKISSRSKAIIVQHTFGLPADLKKIMLLAKRNNLKLIEDCALSIGAKFDGRHTGTFGDISIFSFGRDKVISGVTGGMAVTNDPDLADRLEKERARLKLPSRAWTIKQLLHPIIMNYMVLPTYNMSSIGKIILEGLKAVHIMPKAVHKSEKIGEKTESVLGLMPNALALLAMHQFKKLDRFNKHRQKIVNIYNAELKSIANKKFVLPEEETNDSKYRSIHLRYNIKTSKAKDILAAARKENIILGDWYRPAIAPHGVSFAKMQYDPDTCPAAERVARESLNLPTNINIKEHDALKITHFLKTYLIKNQND